MCKDLLWWRDCRYVWFRWCLNQLLSARLPCIQHPLPVASPQPQLEKVTSLGGVIPFLECFSSCSRSRCCVVGPRPSFRPQASLVFFPFLPSFRSLPQLTSGVKGHPLSWSRWFTFIRSGSTKINKCFPAYYGVPIIGLGDGGCWPCESGQSLTAETAAWPTVSRSISFHWHLGLQRYSKTRLVHWDIHIVPLD